MKKGDIVLLASVPFCLAAVIIFGIPGLIPFSDERMGELLCGGIPRIAAGLFLVLLIAVRGDRGRIAPAWRMRDLLWSIPCLLVALANFPFSALISGKAYIERVDLIWLFFMKIAGIALLEELFFRGILLPFLTEKLKRCKYLFSALVASTLFALVHLLNLFYGADVGATFLQVGYTFLIGCMLAVLMLKTGNVWLCVLVHALFDVGGLLVTDLGGGTFQDMTFWILTAVFGVICAVHVIITIIHMERGQKKNPSV